MKKTKPKYRLPKGYLALFSLDKLYMIIRNPIKFISLSMQKFGGSYSVKLVSGRYVVMTQDAGLIEHILRTNQQNYHKSEISAVRGARYFGHGLLFANGSAHLRQRRLIQPKFNKKKIDELEKIILRTVDTFLDKFPVGKDLNMCPLMQDLAFEIVVDSLFDIDIPEQKKIRMRTILDDLQKFVFSETNNPYQQFLYPLTGKDKRAKKKSKELRGIIEKVIQERKAEDKSYDDLLDMLIQTRYKDTGEPMELDQIIDESIILIFAGHETTANTLSWMLYLLATHPEVIQSLREVVQQTDITECTRDPHIHALIYETLRLYPPAWMTDRMALADDEHGEFHFPAGTAIIPFFYGVHRDEKHWDRPDEFVPKRFMKEENLRSKAFFPFGAGNRMCIGKYFAMMEMSIFIHRFIEKFNISPTGEVPTKEVYITLRPSSVQLAVEKRDKEFVKVDVN